MINFFQSLQVSRVRVTLLASTYRFYSFSVRVPLFSVMFTVSRTAIHSLLRSSGNRSIRIPCRSVKTAGLTTSVSDFDVAGQSVATVNQLIREFLVRDNHVSNPIVMVSPVLQENGVFVGGAVKTPGRYVISPETDIGLYTVLSHLLAVWRRMRIAKAVQLIRTDDLTAG